MPSRRDAVFAEAESAPDRFDFDAVADVFPDMIERSLPGYAATVALSEVFARRFAQAGSRLYDLGCAWGACSSAMQRGVEVGDCRIVAVDLSAAMVAACRANVDTSGSPPIDVVEQDVRAVHFHPASLVVSNFTFQFLPPGDRDALIGRIFDALLPGGALIVAEKLAFDNAAEGETMDALHDAFRRQNGYSDLEIARKRMALEELMVPDTLDTLARRLHAAGFRTVHVWFRCLGFASLIATK